MRLLLLLTWLGLAMAQDDGFEPDLPPPGPAPAAEDVEHLTLEIAGGLRCPVCQAHSVADSPSETAVTMKNRIRELVALGYDEEQIQDYFVDKYGEWVLLEPPATGMNWVVYLAPGLMLGLGLAWVGTTVIAWRKEPDEVPLPSDQGLVPKDSYEQALLAELED